MSLLCICCAQACWLTAAHVLGTVAHPPPGHCLAHVQFIEEAWQPLAEWVKLNEEGTLGYEVMIADTDPCKVMVFERCASTLTRQCNLTGSQCTNCRSMCITQSMCRSTSSASQIHIKSLL